ncbi:MAG: hypothetical protein K2W82_10790 [Candidatus Obscuribacterales bacterium]|nr:hypothetical protein [Candidatus Obscuribacterales bacterium]
MPLDLRKKFDLTKKAVDITNLDLVAFLDMSGSMGEEHNDPTLGRTTRWNVGIDAVTKLLSQVAQYDADGADVLFFDDELIIKTGVTPEKMLGIAKGLGPRGGTLLAPPLQYAFDKYLKAKPIVQGGGWFSKGKTVGYEKMSPAKQLCLIGYTDGAPSDGNAVAKSIVDATKRIKKDADLGILLIQVGNNSGAKAYLERLNNDLESEGADCDCVAVCNIEDIIHSKFTPEECIRLAFNG